MKCVIFFCLLAFCAFEIVRADQLLDYLDHLHKKSVDEINNIANPIVNTIQVEIDAAEKKGINTGDCMESSSISMKTYVDPRIVELDNCRDKAAENRSIPFAKKCFKDAIAALTKEACSVATSAEKCIENCSHMDCSEDE